MGNILAKLLRADEPFFSMSIKRLEEAAGRPGQDVRLMGDIIQKTHAKYKQFGLDAHDTTGRELYAALLAKVKTHDEHLVKHIGGKDPADVQKLLPLIKRAIDKADLPRSAWVLKKSVAKRMLHDTPPTRIMKHLSYESVESMTKRENIAEIFGALRFAETDSWLNRFNNKYKRLQPSDFETRDIEVVIMDKDRWGSIAEDFVKTKRHNVAHLKELGVLLMLPTRLETLPGITINALPLMLHYLNEIRLYSAFFKLQQVKLDFGKIVADTLNVDIKSTAEMAGSQVHWRVIQRYYGKQAGDLYPGTFGPHVQAEDLHWRKAIEQLYRIDPELKFWKDLDYVGVIASDGKPVSLNLMDISMSYFTAAPYERRIIFHMQESLWNELYVRYMGNKALEQQVLRQLDGSMVDIKVPHL